MVTRGQGGDTGGHEMSGCEYKEVAVEFFCSNGTVFNLDCGEHESMHRVEVHRTIQTPIDK